jgi:hypothetical protein
MARRARPTLRCLREDLMQAVPPADTPLDEVPHPLLAKASERFADDGTPASASRPSTTRFCSR